MSPANLSMLRGEIWEVRFDPSEGDEIKKIRPAVVLTPKGVGRMSLQIVVPITGWQPPFARYPWMVHLLQGATNGLDKESAADTFQVKSVSTNRFQRKIGVLTDDTMSEITAATALCIGYQL